MASSEIFSDGTTKFGIDWMTGPHKHNGKLEGWYRILTRETARYLFYSYPEEEQGKYHADAGDPLKWEDPWPFSFNVLPIGDDWNVGYLTKQGGEGPFIVTSTTKMAFSGIEPPDPADVPRFACIHACRIPDGICMTDPQMLHGTWCGMFQPKDSRRMWGRELVHSFVDTLVGGGPYWGLFGERFEARVCSAAHGHGLTPPLLGWITDNGGESVIGFAVDHVGGRVPTPDDDLDVCRDALAKLHGLGIVYGWELNRNSFIIIEDDGGGEDGNGKPPRRRALMQGFKDAVFTNDKQKMAEEMERLPAALKVEWIGHFPRRRFLATLDGSDSSDKKVLYV